MAFIFEVLFEIFGEFLLQLVFEMLAQTGMRIVRDKHHPVRQPSAWFTGLGYACFGALAAGLSLWLIPHHMLATTTLRIGYLVLAPIGAGAAIAGIGLLRIRQGKREVGIDRFVYGYIFALVFALVRYYFAV